MRNYLIIMLMGLFFLGGVGGIANELVSDEEYDYPDAAKVAAAAQREGFALASRPYYPFIYYRSFGSAKDGYDELPQVAYLTSAHHDLPAIPATRAVLGERTVEWTAFFWDEWSSRAPQASPLARGKYSLSESEDGGSSTPARNIPPASPLVAQLMLAVVVLVLCYPIYRKLFLSK